MFESSHRHRTACAIALAVVLLLTVVLPGLALAQATAARVVDVKCQGGAVVAIAVQVDKPGIAVVAWDNGKACGPTA